MSVSLFQGTAEFYRQFRSGVPADVAAILLEAAPDRRPRSLLDVGTGTGFVVEALSDGVDDVIGIDVDVDADLLAVARRSVEPRPGQHLALVQARAGEFAPPVDWTARVRLQPQSAWMSSPDPISLNGSNRCPTPPGCVSGRRRVRRPPATAWFLRARLLPRSAAPHAQEDTQIVH
jgi:SAM-dependent methyltransferase